MSRPNLLLLHVT